jgi:uncharacterized protein YcbK (DUF882 family)
MRLRRRVLMAGIAAVGLALVSGTPYSRAAAHAHNKTLAPSPDEAKREAASHVVTTFELRSANTLESITVRYVDDVVDPASQREVDHLMRCLRTESVKPIDPRLIDALRALSREVDGTLELISGYRAPQSWRDNNFHNRAQAADVRVKGMSAWKLRKIARTLGVKGVGWYPTTNMIHIDTRDDDYFWTDWSGPGQIGREIRTR